MKVLHVGGPFDGKRVEMVIMKTRYEVSRPSESGPIRFEYERITFLVDGNFFDFYAPKGTTKEKLLSTLVERYPGMR